MSAKTERDFIGNNGATLGTEQKAAANKPRSNLDAAEYRHLALGALGTDVSIRRISRRYG